MLLPFGLPSMIINSKSVNVWDNMLFMALINCAGECLNIGITTLTIGVVFIFITDIGIYIQNLRHK